MGLLDGKVAFITGGARGQGRAHALASAGEGADVAVFDIAEQIETVPYPMSRESDLAETIKLVGETGQKALSFVGDVRSQEQLNAAVSETIDEFGHIDILLANAGIWSQGNFWELSEDTWNDMMAVTLAGVWRAAKAVAPHMIERQSGSIVITSSVKGLEPGAGYSHYTAAKHGVIGLMRTFALELAPHNVRCNAICPGAINTSMSNYPRAWDMYAGHKGGTEDDLLQAGYRFHALKGRTFLPPEVIANTALYLNSHLAENVTGVVIPVDAGHMLLTGVNQSLPDR
jgi:SDR family mycofactocin-dependent oxidoreductase